jgi:TolA-binding protein
VDCEKFDRVVLDLLYDELDELTSAAAKRHMEHCSRCRSIGSGLRATREVGILPLIEAPAGLEERILETERTARARLPLRQRLGRAVSVLAGYAMRPQLAMAAVLLLMIGASLVLMRARPGDRDSVQVTERGVPENEGESVAIVPLPEKLPGSDTPSAAQAHGALDEQSEARRGRAKGEASPAPIARADEAPAPAPASPPAAAGIAADPTAGPADGGDSDYNEAMQAYRGGRFAEAQRLFDDVAKAGGINAASASLYAAQSARSSSGCGSAAERFDQVNVRYPGSHIGNEAAWQAADCYRALGQNDRARRNYQALLAAPAYAERAQRAMDELALAENEVASRRSKAKAAAPPARPAAPAAPVKRAAPNPAADTKSGF